MINPVTRVNVWSACVCFCRPRNVEILLNVETFESKTRCFPNPHQSIGTALSQRNTGKGTWRKVEFQHTCGCTLLVRATDSSLTAAGLCVPTLDKQRETKIERKSDTVCRACVCVCVRHSHTETQSSCERGQTHTQTHTHTHTHTHRGAHRLGRLSFHTC